MKLFLQFIDFRLWYRHFERITYSYYKQNIKINFFSDSTLELTAVNGTKKILF